MINLSGSSKNFEHNSIMFLLLSLILSYLISSIFLSHNNTIYLKVLSYYNGIAEVEWKIFSLPVTTLYIHEDLRKALLQKEIECYPKNCRILETEDSITITTENVEYIKFSARVNVTKSNLSLAIYPFHYLADSIVLKVDSNNNDISITHPNRIHACLDKQGESLLFLAPDKYRISFAVDECKGEQIVFFKPQVFEFLIYMIIAILLYHVINTINKYIAFRNVPPRNSRPSLSPAEIASAKNMISYLALREIERDAKENNLNLYEYIANRYMSQKLRKIRYRYPSTYQTPVSDMSPIIDSLINVETKMRKGEYIRPEMKSKYEELRNLFHYDLFQKKSELFIGMIIILSSIIIGVLLNLGYTFDTQMIILGLGIIGLIPLYMTYTSVKDEEIDVLPLAIYLLYILSVFQALNLDGIPNNSNENVGWIYIFAYLGISMITLSISNGALSNILAGFNTPRLRYKLLKNDLYLEILGYAKYLSDSAAKFNDREELDYAIVLDIPSNRIDSKISHNQEMRDLFRSYILLEDVVSYYYRYYRRYRINRILTGSDQ